MLLTCPKVVSCQILHERYDEIKTMLNNDPYKLTTEEWKEIAALAVVREAWGLDDDSTPEEFASLVYAAKFDFVSGSPGYMGDLYILQGDALTEVGPMVLRRDSDRNLIVC